MSIKKLIWFLGIVGTLAYLMSGIYQIRPGERAIVRRFGRVLEDQPGPGIWIGLPWGMERVDRVAMDQVRQVIVGFRRDRETDFEITPPGQMITGDHNLINAQIVVSYTIDQDHLVSYVMHRDHCDKVIARCAESVLAEWVGGHRVSRLLGEGKAELPGEVLRLLSERLTSYELGVHLRSVSLALMLPPEEVQDAFARVNQAATSMQAQINEANQLAGQARSATEAETYRLQQEAISDAQEIRELAIAEANLFRRRLSDYQKNPGVLITGRWESLRQILDQVRKTGRLTPLDPSLMSDQK